jgi:hypothetical protein
MPFKILCKITDSPLGSKFIVRSHSDGEFCVLTSIKKNNFESDRLFALKKGLKYQCNVTSLIKSGQISGVNFL